MPVLLLVGAGHAHLYVVKRAGELAAAGYRVYLLAPRFFDYSGVASATAAGALASDAGQIDVRALAGVSGVEFHEGTLESLDPEARIAVTSDGDHLSYDVLSINIGSVVAPAGMHVDPVVLRVKPLSGLADLDARLRASGQQGATVTVVGGGASGLELAAHLSVRSDVVQVRLVEAGTLIGADLPEGARKRIVRLLAARGVAVHTGCVVRDLGERQLVCDDDTEISHDVALLAVGLTAPPLLVELGLGDGRGVPVRATLQHVDRDDIYAVGDCARFLPGPLPRIGVHGVRQGPVLLRSLLMRVRGEPLPVYEPQRRALSILDLGDGAGLAVWGPRWWYGAGPLRLKRYIDRRWLRTYRE
ncbi:FAD-dependent oxidoreductase [Nocardioides sp. InS609-2]|uniref:NAD(P)/FAD-dependent oxidoreductase n=1 Tax=Nocardioides sp. InS609-2 TaxID=2760705 RepID=UPI0020BFEF00|nr:FAD-dependent oxidoreductase [Nocardioides sp. InS609-2]